MPQKLKPRPAREIADFCRRHRVRRLSFFSSVLRDDFKPGSDVDVLVEFEPDTRVGVIRLAGLELELGEILGHKAKTAVNEIDSEK